MGCARAGGMVMEMLLDVGVTTLVRQPQVFQDSLGNSCLGQKIERDAPQVQDLVILWVSQVLPVLGDYRASRRGTSLFPSDERDSISPDAAALCT